MSAAMTKISSTFPAALASAHNAKSATGSSTSCTHLGTIARGGSACRGSSGESGATTRSSSLGEAAGGGAPFADGAVCPFVGSAADPPLPARLDLPIIYLPPSPEYG